MDTPYEERPDLYLSDELAAFPYVNGGLFQDENIVIPQLTEALKTILLESAHFDWSKISPTIFGAVFESTLNPETRRSGGMHYTSIENIHKVIDPLFLDDLKAELAEIRAIAVQNEKTRKLKLYQQKLAGLTFLEKTLPTLIQTNVTQNRRKSTHFLSRNPKSPHFPKINASLRVQKAS